MYIRNCLPDRHTHPQNVTCFIFCILTSDKRTENNFILSGSFSKQFGSKQREYQKFLPPEFFLFWQFPVSERSQQSSNVCSERESFQTNFSWSMVRPCPGMAINRNWVRPPQVTAQVTQVTAQVQVQVTQVQVQEAAQAVHAWQICENIKIAPTSYQDSLDNSSFFTNYFYYKMHFWTNLLSQWSLSLSSSWPWLTYYWSSPHCSCPQSSHRTRWSGECWTWKT